MSRRRWIADEITGDRAALTGEHADHLMRVLRVRVGQQFDVVAGAVVRRGRVVALSDGRVELELGEELPSVVIAKITLVLAIFKFDRMEWALEKCTELGVSRIVPVVARRTDAHLAAASEKRAERWRRLALQAAEQSRRAGPPEIKAPLKLADATELPGNLRIVLAESEQQPLRDVLESHMLESPAEESDSPQDQITLAVGPEGGWTEEEMELFRRAGWIFASLGKTILRAETAAIAATAIVVSQLG